MSYLFSILRILPRLPWWGYFLLAAPLGMVTMGVYNDYAGAQANAELAREAGVPPVTPLDRYDPNRSPTPIGEAQVSGVLRVDLGVNRTGDSTTAKTYVILDSETGRGPLMALLMTRSEAERGLAHLMDDAGADGRVVVTGFRRTLDRGTISGQMLLRGETREIVLLAPYFGNREAELTKLANSDWPFLLVLAGLTSVCVLFGLYRFRRWRNRASSRQVLPTSSKAPDSPWDGAERSAARPAKVPTDYVMTPDGRVIESSAAKPSAAATLEGPWGVRQSSRPSNLDPGPQAQPEIPTQAAAPVFKTPDEIIRATFGRVTRTGDVGKGEAD